LTRLRRVQLTSPAFNHRGEMPARHTGDGENLSPALRWSDVPEGNASLVLIVEDPDAPDPAAPQRTSVHWVLYDIPPGAGGLHEGARSLPAGTREGLNGLHRPGWGGPCPPIGRHRYFFKLYALDRTLPVLPLHATNATIEQEMRGHVIARAGLIGIYRKRRA
jgi:Raf kinase inhibitor-like YbhB/YbcL family protein